MYIEMCIHYMYIYIYTKYTIYHLYIIQDIICRIVWIFHFMLALSVQSVRVRNYPNMRMNSNSIWICSSALHLVGFSHGRANLIKRVIPGTPANNGTPLW